MDSWKGMVAAASLLACWILVTPLAAKRKPKPPEEPPPGRIRSFADGIDMIGKPAASALNATELGVRARVVAGGAFVSIDLSTMELLEKSNQARDDFGIRELLQSRMVGRLETGTLVQIIDRAGVEELQATVKQDLLEYGDFANRMATICVGMNWELECKFPRSPKVIPDPLSFLRLKIRILEGPLSDAAGWLRPSFLGLQNPVGIQPTAEAQGSSGLK